MFDSLFLRREEKFFPETLYRLTLDLFALVQQWHPTATGPQRGRLFESLLTRYGEAEELPLSEAPGSRTIRGVRSASGLMHENDAVFSFPEFTIHFELKHLSSNVNKNDLLIFNQKGIDFLLGTDRRIRRLPLYRIFLSGGLLSPSARRFALQWGISVIEPDRLPMLVLHWLAGRSFEQLRYVSLEAQNAIWDEFPVLLCPLQTRLHRAANLLATDEPLITDTRLDWALNHAQRVIGDHYWNALDEEQPLWLDDQFDKLARQLGIDAT